MRGQWTIADYGSKDYVNILDEHGDRVAWQVQREHAERIMAGQELLLASESEMEVEWDE